VNRIDAGRCGSTSTVSTESGVVQRAPAVGVRRGLPDDHHVLDARRVAQPGQHVLEEDVFDDQHARLGRAEDVGDAGASGGVVDRHFDRAKLQDPEPRVEELGPVAHHDRDALALGHAQVLQSSGDVAGALGRLGIRHGVIVEDDEHAVAELCRLLVDQGR